MPEEEKLRNGLLGGNMMTSFKRAGMVGAITDGPSRDVDEIRPLGVQYMVTGMTAGHGDLSLQAINDRYLRHASGSWRYYSHGREWCRKISERIPG